jgi:hypothetical protein
VSESAGQPAPPLRTWRPMAAWTAGMLLIFVLTWCAWSAVSGVIMVRDVVKANFIGTLSTNDAIRQLGGPETAARRVHTYLCLPGWLVPEQRTAVSLLDRCGQAGLNTLTKALSHQDAVVRAEAAQTIRWMVRATIQENPGGIPQAQMMVLPLLIAKLFDPDSTVQSAAAGALSEFGAEARAAIPRLTEGLASEDEGVRSACAYALGEVGPEAAMATAALSRNLRDWSDTARENAARALAAIGPGAREATPSLAGAMLHDKIKLVRRLAAEALGKIGPDAKEAVAALIQAATSDEAWEVRGAAIEALGLIGPSAWEAVPALKKLQNEFSGVEEALRRIRGEEPAR